MHPLRTHYDKLLVVAASLLLGWGLIETVKSGDRMMRLRAEPVATTRQEAVYEPAVIPDATERNNLWNAPRADLPERDGGAGLFTAPDSTGDLRAAGDRGAVTFAAEGTGPVLLAVRPELFPFQFRGYLGDVGAEKVVLSAEGRTEPLLVAVGEPLPGSNMVLKSFGIQRLIVGENEAGPIQEAVALAVLRNDSTGVEVSLDDRGACYTGRWLALFQGAGEDSEPVEVGVGDQLMVRDVQYRVRTIRAEPAEVVLGSVAAPRESLILRLDSRPGAGPVAAAAGDVASSHLATADE